MLMKIAVIGVGAVGCYYGGMLARAVLAAQMIGAGHSRNERLWNDRSGVHLR